jgi:hypothetical protein
MAWQKINGRTPKKTIIWLGGYWRGRWCTHLTIMQNDIYPEWATYWHDCFIPDSEIPKREAAN